METDFVPGDYKTIAEIKRKNAETGRYFFSPSTMRFFNSRVSDRIHGGCLFVTSEKREDTDPRRYAIRVAHASGDVESVTDVLYFARKMDAENAASRIAAIMKRYPGQDPTSYHRAGEFKEEIEKVLESYAN